jgi:serpin B
VWGAPQTSFVPAYLDTLAQDYGAGIRLTDFESDAEAARHQINAWVDQQTEDKIKELLAPGTVTGLTRLVLVNAVYFNAAWATPFEPRSTHAGTFHGVSGDATAQLMTHTAEMQYASGAGWQAVSLPYDGKELSFVAVLPDDFKAFEPTLGGATFAAVDAALKTANVALELPRFTIPGASFSLKSALEARGMVDAFTPGKADFAGIAREQLTVADVIHQAFVSVDEAGTEAAAATAVLVVGKAVAEQPVKLTFDKPFVFYVRDDATGAVLFLGRVTSL